jgi:uncharacterized protein YdhG (YjbR/CyaY superfamily)
MKANSVRKTPKTVDAYLATVPPTARAALNKMRKTIHAAAPGVEEGISYGMPAFGRGRGLVAFAAFKNHCTLFAGAETIRNHKAALAGYEVTKGGIHFDPARPMPAALVRQLVKARLSQNEARGKK